jgi:magnesium-transporting ATPase (P-type)
MGQYLQAASRLAENGPNKLSPPKDKPEWLKYLLQYTNPLLALLIVAGVLTFVAYGIQVLIHFLCTTSSSIVTAFIVSL